MIRIAHLSEGDGPPSPSRPELSAAGAVRPPETAPEVPMKSHPSKTEPEPTEFARRVYDLLRQVPPGRVVSYGEIARALGNGSPRAVGQALRCNPYAPEVPCHRVIAADGRIGGFQGCRVGPALRRKLDLLAREGVVFEKGRVKDSAFVRLLRVK